MNTFTQILHFKNWFVKLPLWQLWFKIGLLTLNWEHILNTSHYIRARRELIIMSNCSPNGLVLMCISVTRSQVTDVGQASTGFLHFLWNFLMKCTDIIILYNRWFGWLSIYSQCDNTMFLTFCPRHFVHDILSATFCPRHSVHDDLYTKFCPRRFVHDVHEILSPTLNLSTSFCQRHIVHDILSNASLST